MLGLQTAIQKSLTWSNFTETLFQLQRKPTINSCGKTNFSFMEPTNSTSLYEHKAVRQQANERTSVCVLSVQQVLYRQYSIFCGSKSMIPYPVFKKSQRK